MIGRLVAPKVATDAEFAILQRQPADRHFMTKLGAHVGQNIEDLSFDEDVSVPRRTHAVLDVLFPKQQGYMWWSDRF